MTDRLIKNFVKDSENITNPAVRKDYGYLSGGVGICVNVLLCTLKLIVGYLSGSVGIIGDGINNLSDVGSSVVTMLGLKLSAKPADEAHPYGHGRIEYIVVLIIAAVIFFVGLELVKASYDKLMAPEAIEVSVSGITVMLFSIALKLWLRSFNQYLGKKTNSPAFDAVAADSTSDVVATSVVIICLFVYALTGYNIDGGAGLLVGCFIMYSGWQTASEALQPILGSPADEDVLDEIRRIALQDCRVLGVHDVMLHSYGPGSSFVSAHIEVDASMSLMEAHSVASRLEKNIEEQLSLHPTVHIDPRLIGNEKFDELERTVIGALRNIDGQLAMHDLHVFHGTRLVFDVEVPYKYPLKNEELEGWIIKKVEERLPGYSAVVRLDRV